MKPLYSDNDGERLAEIPSGDLPSGDYRKPWRRDYARVLHSPAFRRLQGKTQLFPGNESDFFRNRLTHSLEVAQIAKSIAIRLNHTGPFLTDNKFRIKYDLCELAGLAHDLGHPPFGHNGELALDQQMTQCGGFEGNAQTLRILAKLEKRNKNKSSTAVGIGPDGEDRRYGLNLTYRSLASILKYDRKIPRHAVKKRHIPVKGYYACDTDIVRRIKQHVIGSDHVKDFRTIECSIMDVADDIDYSTYDVEDALKAGFTSPLDMLSLPDERIELIQEQIKRDLSKQDIKDCLYRAFGAFLTGEDERNIITQQEYVQELTSSNISSYNLGHDGYLRAEHTSHLVGWLIRNIEFKPNDKYPALSSVTLKEDVQTIVEVLKKFSYVTFINSSLLKISEYRGKGIVDKLFKAIKDSTAARSNLLPEDFRQLHKEIKQVDKDRIICDFIAGMTDRYALEFYGRLFSENPQTIFKPL